MLDLLNIGGGLGSDSNQCVGLLLLQPLSKLLLELGLVSGTTRSVLLVHLLVLGKLLLELRELGLELGLLVDLALLVGVDDLGSNKLLKSFALVLAYQVGGLADIALR
jgi:hypothetical protein